MYSRVYSQEIVMVLSVVRRGEGVGGLPCCVCGVVRLGSGSLSRLRIVTGRLNVGGASSLGGRSLICGVLSRRTVTKTAGGITTSGLGRRHGRRRGGGHSHMTPTGGSGGMISTAGRKRTRGTGRTTPTGPRRPSGGRRDTGGRGRAPTIRIGTRGATTPGHGMNHPHGGTSTTRRGRIRDIGATAPTAPGMARSGMIARGTPRMVRGTIPTRTPRGGAGTGGPTRRGGMMIGPRPRGGTRPIVSRRDGVLSNTSSSSFVPVRSLPSRGVRLPARLFKGFRTAGARPTRATARRRTPRPRRRTRRRRRRRHPHVIHPHSGGGNGGGTDGDGGGTGGGGGGGFRHGGGRGRGRRHMPVPHPTRPGGTGRGLPMPRRRRRHGIVRHRGPCRFSSVLGKMNMLRVVRSKCKFLHSSSCGCLSSPSSVCMSRSRVGLFNLGANSIMRKIVHPPGRKRGCFPLMGMSGVGKHSTTFIHSHIPFRRLAPLFPSRGFGLYGNNCSSSVSTHMMSLFTPVNGNRHTLVMTRPGANGAVLVGSVTGTVTTGRPRMCVVVLLVSRHPRRMASVTHDIGTRIVTSAFSRPTRHRIGVTNVMLRGTGELMRYNRSMIVFLSSVAHLTHTCGAMSPTSNGMLSNNISTGTLRGPGHFFNTTHGVRGNNSLAVVTATLVSANSGVSRIVFRRFGNANGVRLRLSHGLSGGHVFPTIGVATSDAHHSSLLLSGAALSHV